MELKDTIKMMDNADYKERFKAEYFQLKIRLDKLINMYNNWDHLDFVPTCPKEIYHNQINYMSGYLQILEERAKLENVDLKTTV